MIAAQIEQEKKQEEKQIDGITYPCSHFSQARPNLRPRSPGEVNGTSRARKRVSDAQSLQEIYRTSSAANIAGPSTSTDVADSMTDTTANSDDVDMPTESDEDSDPESSDFYFDAESQFNDDRLSGVGIKEEENPNRSIVVRALNSTSFQSF